MFHVDFCPSWWLVISNFSSLLLAASWKHLHLLAHLGQGKWPPWAPSAHHCTLFENICKQGTLRVQQSKAHCGHTEARRTKRVNVERACPECYSKSVRPHLPGLMPAFPSEARGRVSRHLFKSRNFRPFSMTAAFLVTAKHCLRWNKLLRLF